MKLTESMKTKRCLMVCGGGGVGKTTIAASLAIAATHAQKRILVVTIDPAKRLAEAFGFSMKQLEENGEPLLLSDEIKKNLGIPADSSLHVGLLNPKYVLEQVLVQTLSEQQRAQLKRTMLYSQLSEMIYGLQEYTAYEWVTRMIQNNEYDLIVLDTPPAFHAKDFFNAPEKIRHLMESRVFQIFLPKKASWFTKIINFSWVEKLLGEKIFSESKVFFETFTLLRDRILERCELLSRFFTEQSVSVVSVSTPEATAQLELEGLITFLKTKKIPVETIVMNQVEQAPKSASESIGAMGAAIHESGDAAAKNNTGTATLREKIEQLHSFQRQKAERAQIVIQKCREKYPASEVIVVPMDYAETGFDILRSASAALTI
jgi:anion-transporting  ArsA/GET3 family ATPase